mmetsp:Transcript_40112/g.64455  ORF Transcript_40112/g.64455 Transcript_40112/m.64455 type:complete len:383 (+) Transcript_40112:89-1237(+)
MADRGYLLAWVISDSIKGFLSLLIFLYAISLIQHPTKNVALTRIRYLTICLSGILVVFFLGAHEPLFFGWRFYLIGTAVVMILAMDTFLYITLVFSSALYTVTNRSSFSPSNGPTLILCGILLVSTVQITSVIGVLATNKFSWNSGRHLALALAMLIGGSYFIYSLHRLRGMIMKTRQNLVSIPIDNPKSGTSSKGTKVENSSLRMVKQQNVNKMMKLSRDNSFNPPGSLISGNSPRFSAAPSGAPQSVDTTHQGSSHESKYSVTPKQQLLRMDEPPSVKKSSKKNTPQHSRGTVQSLSDNNPQDIEKKVLLKMKRLLFVAYTLLPTIFLVSLATFTMQLQASETYSEIIETENRRYDPFFEIITFAAILTTGVFLYYALGK